MPDDNEIDEILNEIKSKDISQNNDENLNLTFSEDTELPEKKVEAPTEFELVDEKLSADTDVEELNEVGNNSMDNKKKTIIAVVAIILIIAVAVGVFAVVKLKSKEPETTTTAPTTTTTTTAAPIVYKNPLTNEKDYNKNAVDKRPVALVVENAYDARPQWGMDDQKNSPDIVIEGEVEGGETRMLWLFADYTALPEQVGPMRSARPPFIKFSELFDSIFVHWGQSSSKGNYVGADSVFSQDNVDHINQMAFSDNVGLFGRDKSRNVASEHTGVLYGANMPAAIEQVGFRTDIKKDGLTSLSFNDGEKPVGTSPCNSLDVTFSSSSRTRSWTYGEDKQYHTSDYKNDFARKNVLILYDSTEYIVKENYKNGRSETYCNYRLSGGSGKLASLGTVIDITWSVENGGLVIKDSAGKPVNLNPGKTWIGWASSNNGGSDQIG